MLFATGDQTFYESATVIHPTEEEVLGADEYTALVAITSHPPSRSRAKGAKTEFVLCPVNPPGEIDGKYVGSPSCAVLVLGEKDRATHKKRHVSSSKSIPPQGYLLSYNLRRKAEYVQASAIDILNSVRVGAIIPEQIRIRGRLETFYFVRTTLSVCGLRVDGWTAVWEGEGVNTITDAFLATRVVSEIVRLQPELKSRRLSSTYYITDMETLRAIVSK